MRTAARAFISKGEPRCPQVVSIVLYRERSIEKKKIALFLFRKSSGLRFVCPNICITGEVPSPVTMLIGQLLLNQESTGANQEQLGLISTPTGDSVSMTLGADWWRVKFGACWEWCLYEINFESTEKNSSGYFLHDSTFAPIAAVAVLYWQIEWMEADRNKIVPRDHRKVAQTLSALRPSIPMKAQLQPQRCSQYTHCLAASLSLPLS